MFKRHKILFLLVLLNLFSFQSLNFAFEDKVVAIVNKDVITQEELDNYIIFLRMQMSAEQWHQNNITKAKALENLIEDKIIVQEAQRKQIKTDDSAVEQRINKIKASFASIGEFEEALMTEGISLTELKKRIKEQLLINKVLTEEIRSRIIVSPKEVTDYYQQHIEEYKIPQRVLVESIFVEQEDLANRIYNSLKNGEDFSKLQKDYSTKESLGLISKGEMRKDLDEFIFNLQSGEVSSPFKTEEGYFIFLVKDKYPQEYKRLLDVQADITDKIANMKYNLLLKSWLDKLKKDSYIVTFIE